MADLGKRIRTFTAPEPLPMPQFAPKKVEAPVPERELVPVGPKKQDNYLEDASDATMRAKCLGE